MGNRAGVKKVREIYCFLFFVFSIGFRPTLGTVFYTSCSLFKNFIIFTCLRAAMGPPIGRTFDSEKCKKNWLMGEYISLGLTRISRHPKMKSMMTDRAHVSSWISKNCSTVDRSRF